MSPLRWVDFDLITAPPLLRDTGTAVIQHARACTRARQQERRGRAQMTNRIALGLGAAIVGLVLVDLLLFGTEHLVFLGKKILELIEWIAFWR